MARPTPRRIGKSKLVQGGRVQLSDGTRGYIQRVLTPPQKGQGKTRSGGTKNRRAIVLGDDGKSYNVRAADIKPMAGRPTAQPVYTNPTGQLDPKVALGQKPDARGNVRSAMPAHVFNKLVAMGKIGGGGSEGGVYDPTVGPDLIDVRKEVDDDDDFEVPFRKGGAVKSKRGFSRVRRKSSFKGVF